MQRDAKSCHAAFLACRKVAFECDGQTDRRTDAQTSDFGDPLHKIPELDDTRRARWPFRDLLCRVSTKISYVREVQHDYAIMM